MVRDRVTKHTLVEIARLPEVQKADLGLLFTPSEILQQPESWKETFGIIRDRQEEIRKFLRKGGLDGNNNQDVIVSLVGAGTSDYIGRSLTGLLRSKWGSHAATIPSTDLLTEIDDFMASSPDNGRHIWLSFSRSGDSYEGVRSLEKAFEKFPEVQHIIVTCNAKSRMATDLSEGRENVLCLVLSDDVNDRGLAMTSSFTNMVVAGQSLANIDGLVNYETTLNALVNAGKQALPAISGLASELAGESFERICFLGSGTLKAVADESSLKVLELSAGYHSTMSESFLGLRHGPLSWLNRDALVVGFISNDNEKARVELGLLDEIHRKHAVGRIVAITPRLFDNIDAYTDHSAALGIPEWLDDQYRPPIDVLFAQCFGLFSSLSRGLKPDSPSSDGKIHRVVSDISII